MKALAKEIRRHLQSILLDLGNGKFWIPVCLGLMAAVLGALTISTTTPRLVTTVISLVPRYYLEPTREAALLDRDFAVAKLEEQVKARLARRLGLAFGGGSDTAALDDDQKNEPLLSGVGMLAVNVAVNVTNIGGGSSSISQLDVFIVEEIDGVRRPVESPPGADIRVKIGSGEPTRITPENGKTFYFTNALSVLVDYEVIQLLTQRATRLKAKNPSEVVTPFLDLIALGEPRRQARLRVLADRNRRCRLLLVAQATDILDRIATGEAELINAFPSPPKPSL